MGSMVVPFVHTAPGSAAGRTAFGPSGHCEPRYSVAAATAVVFETAASTAIARWA